MKTSISSLQYNTLLPARFGTNRPWVSYTRSVGSVMRNTFAVSLRVNIFGSALMLFTCCWIVLVTVSMITCSSLLITSKGKSTFRFIEFSIRRSISTSLFLFYIIQNWTEAFTISKATQLPDRLCSCIKGPKFFWYVWTLMILIWYIHAHSDTFMHNWILVMDSWKRF